MDLLFWVSVVAGLLLGIGALVELYRIIFKKEES
jgi:hypothetical protein